MNQYGFDQIVIGRLANGGDETWSFPKRPRRTDILVLGGDGPAAVDGQTSQRSELGIDRSRSACSPVETRAYCV